MLIRFCRSWIQRLSGCSVAYPESATNQGPWRSVTARGPFSSSTFTALFATSAAGPSSPYISSEATLSAASFHSSWSHCIASQARPSGLKVNPTLPAVAPLW